MVGGGPPEKVFFQLCRSGPTALRYWFYFYQKKPFTCLLIPLNPNPRYGRSCGAPRSAALRSPHPLINSESIYSISVSHTSDAVDIGSASREVGQ